jgi:hypothetical protein
MQYRGDHAASTVVPLLLGSLGRDYGGHLSTSRLESTPTTAADGGPGPNQTLPRGDGSTP